jgi:hypothetical protein
MGYMEHQEETALAAPPDHYGRDTLSARIQKLKPKEGEHGHPWRSFEAGLNFAGVSAEELMQRVQDPTFLEDEKVEPFMRELSIIMMDMKMELGEGKPSNPELSKKLQNNLTALIKKYDL